MMARKFVGYLFFIGSVLLLFRVDCFAEVISSTELINNAKLYDGKIISYSGETIGDIMARKEYAWVNLNDGKNAVGIWIKRELTHGIQYSGSYNVKGDWVEIKGIFHRSCPEHGGDFDIHAQSIIEISFGSKIPHSIKTGAINSAFVLFSIVLAAFLLRMRQPRKPASNFLS